ncbi:hypothetical protein AOCH_001427 [Aspergillus ochraceoroseus]|uniref:Zn(2)-C6 fungal-type domain-containing protein n=1 Tax=Aspergillus ochraceoroseus TaxID=138278 RepID=A0A0F8WSN8_9EURO|nr:hypothetical protein AOCH_001427 [Aspergillus ochraceoroseus]
MATYLDHQNLPQSSFDNSSAHSGQRPTSQSHTSTAGQSSGDGNYIPRPKRIACAVCRRRKLRCDGKKPSCGTCSRLSHECTYDEARKKSGPKRGYVKQLEARLAQVETLLKTQEPPTIPQTQAPSFPVPIPDEPTDMTDVPLIGHEFNPSVPLPEESSNTGPAPSFVPEGMSRPNTFGWDMISLGLEEPLPAQEIIDDLTRIYFEKIHPVMPIIHRPRHLAAMDFAPNARPPICLQYIIWCQAASTDDKYSNLHGLFYQRARKYAELDEMKGLGECILTLAHAQTWLLIAAYEYKMMFFPRAWLSSGKTARLALMMGLHRLDGLGLEVKQCLAPPRDWVEKEERRRVFWMTFCVDRYASIGTGWPVVLDENDILTNLPASEDSFVKGNQEETARLSEVLVGEKLSTLAPFASVAFLSCMFGRNLTHLHRPEPQDNDSDLNGIFWQRHRSHDNILLHFALSMPSCLRLPTGMADPNVIFCNMAVHTSTICLHQAAIFKAEKNKMAEQIILESKRRCIVAADQISSIMKMVSCMDMATMNPFMAFCVYVAARVFVQYLKFRPDDTAARSSLQFVFSVLDALKNKNPLTESFLVQLDVDIEGTPFQDLRLPTSNRMPFIHMQGNKISPAVGEMPCHFLPDRSHPRQDSGTWGPPAGLRSNLPVCLPNRSKQPRVEQSSSSRGKKPANTATSLPGFSKTLYNFDGTESRVLGTVLDLELPSTFNDHGTSVPSNSAPETSTPSTMNSSSSGASTLRTDQSSSPKETQQSSLNTSIQDSVGSFDGTNINQYMNTSTSNPFFSTGIITPLNSTESDGSLPMPSTWDFPMNVNSNSTDDNIDLMVAGLDSLNGAQWANILGSGGWNP